MLLTVRALGGGTWALVVTALASAAAPLFMRTSVLLQPVVFDQLWCVAALFGVVLAIVRREPRWWLLAGMMFGLGTLTKFSAPLYGVLAFIATLVVPAARAQLRTRWPWLAAVLALVVGSASLTGQMVHGWPFFAQMRVLRAQQLARVTAGEYLIEQPMLLGGAALLALAGIVWACTRRPVGDDGDSARAPTRLHAVRWLATFAALLVTWYLVVRGKGYYAGPAYPLLLAAGSVTLERLRGRLRMATRVVVPAVLVATGLVLLPLGVPVFAPEAMARYAARFGGSRSNVGVTLDLPQDYADMLGWRAQAATVAAAWRALSPADRARAGIVATNYGRAGAQALHGAAYGLPYPVSIVGDFWAWGPGPRDGDVMLVVVDDPNAPYLRELWREVRVVAEHRDARRVPEERVVYVMLVRGLRMPLAEFWRRMGPVWG